MREDPKIETKLRPKNQVEMSRAGLGRSDDSSWQRNRTVVIQDKTNEEKEPF